MNEIEKRARELLAAEVGSYQSELLLEGLGAGMVGSYTALRAIVAALYERKEEVDALRRGCHRLKQQSLRRARTIKARNQTIRELQAAQP